jgi:hypothetical protein
MKHFILISIFLSMLFSISFAGESLLDFSIGIQFNANVNILPKDLSLGANATSPSILDKFAFSADFYYGFLRGVRKTAIIKNEEVFNFLLYRISLLILGGNKSHKIRPYMKLGYVGIESQSEIFPFSHFDGFYAGFGVNIRFEKWENLGLFVELGAQGLTEEIVLDKLMKDPLFGSGINFSSGIKFFF